VFAVRPLAGLALATAALLLPGCGGESDGTFDHEGFPFTFAYPESFEEIDDVEVDQQLGAASDDTVAVGLDDHDLITVERYTLQVAVDEAKLGLAKREIDGLLAQINPDAGKTTATEIAGLPALAAGDIPVSSIDGATSDISIIFDGNQEYVINCQSTPDHSDEVAEACDQALETLSFE
jgi:hypothetical protein